MDDLSALVGGPEGRQSGGDLGRRDAVLKRHGSRAQHVVHVVLAEQRTLHRLSYFAADEIEARAFGSKNLNVFRPHICQNTYGWLHSEQDDLALEVAPELAHIFIIGIQHGCAAVRKSFDQFIFCAGDSGDGVEALQMHGSNVGHDGLVRRGNAGQGGDFAGVGHPHLNHGEIVFRLESQQPEWQTKMIIEISLGAMHAVLDGEQMGHRLFGGGLAHRPGDADGSFAPNFSDRRRQRLESNETVVDGKQAGGLGIARQSRFLDNRANRAPAQCLLDEVVTVEAFAFDRKEEFAGLHRAGVDGISLSHGAPVVLAG